MQPASIAFRRTLIHRSLAGLLAALVPTGLFPIPGNSAPTTREATPRHPFVNTVAAATPTPAGLPAIPDPAAMSLAELRKLIEQLQDLRRARTWAEASWVWVDVSNWSRAHLQVKAAYLADPTAPAICGKRPPAAWEGMPGVGDMIGIRGREWICKRCVAIYRSQEQAP